ncbi:SDR family oxidoreductase [Schleiferia thermophila]|jgi:NAD(P)-dependent dehydrogenase (short-subunit alcohol dehydrogenase family)|uniref:NAD(P)-dependent dehydrogenase (Short-subunit alcohol dehydrogenase family) n=1 Tax=Schleiferia thermophila TaxID=884107 RepID=A0A369A213_9FLAO|nr:SDR family oxidoreductase [Schleiferia thermophila]KFD39313.1 short-chain dehydrogenase [Schleiferia thermophila str. Yellowstone]RCX03225.1 NAD(P)-dependent dehydrogenase (short-subunit alcohol dehydrogenase family) [Schleiferia thermophila]GCD80352.1 short-chain dehydrogenase [Schleiferia thermophila]
MLNTANTGSMMPPGTFRDKVFWVTGGGTGLGKSMTKYFAELGATVVITSRRQEVLDRTAEEINTSGVEGRVIGISGDVRESEVIEKLADEIFEKYGQLDVLVNNAAGNFISPTERLSANAFDVVIDIVLKGTKNTTLAVGKKWIEKKCVGVMLNITTTYAFTGSGYVVPSAMAKAGVLALTRSLAVEWAKYGIRQVAIAPGPFPTKGAWERLFPGGLDKKLNVINEIPLRRAGEHSELANLAAYLVSDYASFINGEVVVIDGGEWLQGAGEMNFLEALTPEQWDELAKFRK